MNSTDYLDGLNTEQKKAVLATDGPVLIVAGAGAGKTKTLAHRILHLIKSGVRPESILAITFTNKAAREMRERVMGLLENQNFENSGEIKRFSGTYAGEEPVLSTTAPSGRGSLTNPSRGPSQSGAGRTGVSGKSFVETNFKNFGFQSVPFVSTFHSLGVLIIKENAHIFKLPRHFKIFDKADSKKAVKEAITEIGLDPKEHLDKMQNIISSEKSRGVSVAEFLERGAFDFTSEMVKKVWPIYEKILARSQALDFDDLLLKTLHLLSKNKEILQRYQDRFIYIHVDEFQDTNKVQNEIVRLLAEKNKNICVVGDTDQNIYSWRGAEIKNMLHFEKTYPGAQTFFLEQNYRSTKTILAAADEIIQKNNFRIPKKLFTENSDGQKIGIFKARDETDEAQFIALRCKDLIESGEKPDEIAVLYRANFQSRALEEAFLAFGVPYQMLGTKFFERKEIKDTLAYISAALNPENMNDFLRAISTPARGVGKTTMQKIVTDRENELPASMQIKINNFRALLLDFQNILQTEKPSVAVKKIIEKSGMEKMYETGLDEDTDRLENIMELVTLATRYDDLPTENQPSQSYGVASGIEKFLEESSLASDQDSLDGGKAGVRLMTVHSSKGLEFDFVFISGLEADLFPHHGFGERKSGEEKEEERRLFYVALTRARRKLFLTHAETRTIFGKTEVNASSEFLDDISAKYLEKESYAGVVDKEPIFKIEF
jgi:DNA helicase-2/ATP-dependent DNA helicase PcrA